MTQAAPPGEPDDIDVKKLVGFESIDIVGKSRLLELRIAAFLAAIPIYAISIFMTLLAFIMTGSLVIYFIGWLITVPYILACHRLSYLVERLREVTEWCNFDIPDYGDDLYPDSVRADRDGSNLRDHC